ncbi:trafficking protein particle complex subunit 13 [Lepeophtheirus salmonis]|uniref:Trafficking protein particle complex 13 [Xenopus (Silurana) tropicalis] n=1 Tax=Lepeophtheirus salmonis TaxID=72036 RepID=A0A0K2TNX2_LEPSM|nr:trafficking protein particle complex subunit 13-like [Lepeophtheirus salmonis]
MGEVQRTDSRIVEHLLSLKVMRLSRPRFSQNLLITDDSKNALSGIMSSEHLKDPASCKDLPEAALGRLLVLPQSFGMLYLGETFSCYISLHNDSTEGCMSISLKCDLQTTVHRITLYPPNNSKDSVIQNQLLPGDSIDHVLNYEVKDLGTHILVCEVFYSSSKSGTNEKSSFRKFFKFEVKKPLDVQANFHSSDDNEVFVEATIQNATTGCLYLEKVVFEPSNHFNVSSLNSIVGLDEDNSVFGTVNCLQANDSRQYIFCLTPKSNSKSDHKLLKSIIAVGKIDVIWRTNLGERGRIKTSQLQRSPPVMNDIHFYIDSCPSVVMLYQAFNFTAKIYNNSERTLELDASSVDKDKSRMMWIGTTSQKLGLLQPDGCMDLNLSVVPLDTGLQVISGIRITDNLLKRTYEFDDQNQVFVTSDLPIYEAILSQVTA